MSFSFNSGDNNEVVEIIVESKVEGISETLSSLSQLGKRLNQLEATLNKVSGNAGLTKLYSGYKDQTLDKLIEKQKQAYELIKQQTSALKQQGTVIEENAAKTASAQRKSQFSYGFENSKAGQDKFKNWKADIATAGIPIVGKPKDLTMAIHNMRSLKESMGTVKMAGIATEQTLGAIKTGAESAFSSGFSASQKMRVGVNVLKKDLDSVFFNMHDNAKKMQWTGMQMTQGITMPVVGFATAAVQAFDSVNKEMLQLKKVSSFKGDYEQMRTDVRKLTEEYGLTDRVVTGLYTDIAAMGVRGTSDMKTWADSISKLSILGQVDMSAATDLFRVINATFSGGDLNKTIKDIENLNAVADESSIQLKDLVTALPLASPVMKELGFDASGTAIAIASMYHRGIEATEAANALKVSMLRLVDPTKKAKIVLKEMGYALFDNNGSITDADAKIAEMAMKLDGLGQQAKTTALGRLFQPRQASRMSAYFEEVAAGIKELTAANADGKITLEETEKFTTDYARTMVSSGKIGADGVQSAGDRYKKAWEEYKKDPSIGLARLKAELKNILVDIGGEILPPLLNVGQKVSAFFKKLSEMPAPVKKIIGVVMALAASFGPVIYAAAQAQHAIATFGQVATKLLPGGGIKDINEAMAHKLFKENKNRQDIGQIGDRFVQFKHDKRKLPKGATRLDKESFKETVEEKKLDKALEETTHEMDKQSKSAEVLSTRMNKLKTSTANYKNHVKEGFNKGIVRNPHEEDIKLIDEKIKKTRSLAQVESLQMNMRMKKHGIVGLAGPIDRAEGPKVDRQQATADLAKLKATRAELVKLNDAANKKVNLKGGIGGIFKDLTGAGGSGLGKIVQIFMTLTKFSYLGAIVLGLGIGFSVLFKTLKQGWSIIMQHISPALGKLHEAWDKLTKAFSEISNKVLGIINSISGDSGGKDKATSFWNTIGDVISKVIDGISSAVTWVSENIQKLWPIFESMAYKIKDFIGFISSLFSGDWKNAFMYLVAFAYEGIRPVIILFDAIWHAAVSCVQMTLEAFSQFPIIGGWVQSLSDSLEDFKKNSLTDFLDEGLRKNMPPVLSGGSMFDGKQDEKAPAKAGDDAGDKFNQHFDDTVKNDKHKADWVKDFLDAVKARLGEQINSLKDSANKAFDEMQKAEVKYYDDKLKAIDDVEKAEEKLYSEQEYLEKKKEMLYNRALDVQNYQTNRALAIYEGKIDDARMLDLAEKKAKHDFNRDYKKMEQDRSRELVKQQRDEARALIEQQKVELDKRQQLQKEAFDKQLAEITRYTPRTVGEMQNMMDNINGLLMQNQVIGWPAMAKTGGELYMAAIKGANEDIVQDFSWSGQASITNWIAQFASPEVMAILKLKAAGMKDAVDSGLTDMGKNPLEDLKKNNDSLLEGLKEAWNKLFDGLKKGWEDVGKTSKQTDEEAAQDNADSLLDRKANFDASVIDYQNGLRSIGNIITGVIITPFNKIIDVINSVIKGLYNSLPDFAKKAVGWLVGPGNIPQVRPVSNELFVIQDRNEPLRQRDAQRAAIQRARDAQKAKRDALNALAYNAFHPKAHASGGFITRGVHHIVGEGDPRFPEWVIPSDPKYRPQAMSLISSLVKNIGGVNSLPSGISHAAGSAASAAVTSGMHGGTTINVDTMIGEDHWFKSRMSDWDIKVGQKKATSTGSKQRVVSSYNDNNRVRWN